MQLIPNRLSHFIAEYFLLPQSFVSFYVVFF